MSKEVSQEEMLREFYRAFPRDPQTRLGRERNRDLVMWNLQGGPFPFQKEFQEFQQNRLAGLTKKHTDTLESLGYRPGKFIPGHILEQVRAGTIGAGMGAKGGTSTGGGVGNQRYLKDLAPEELLDETYKMLLRDKSRLSGMNYPVYKGKMLPPMSDLTQRARELRSEFSGKPAPYSKKIQSLLDRNTQTITPDKMNELLNTTKESQRGLGQNTLMNTLRKQYGAYMQPREGRISDKFLKDIEFGGLSLKGRLGDINKASSNLEENANAQIIKALQGLQGQKQSRRESLIGNLELFGKQKHLHGDLTNKVERNKFNEELNTPRENMRRLEEVLEPLRMVSGQDVHPDLKKLKTQDVIQGLRAYGIDTSKPVDQWDLSKIGKGGFPGKLMEDLTPEMQQSYGLLGRLSPKFQGSSFQNQKGLLKGLLGAKGVGERAVEDLPESIKGEVANLDREAKQKLKQQINEINGKFIRAGQYGSPQHMKAVEQGTRNVNKASIDFRNRLIEDNLQKQLSMQHGSQLGAIRKLGLTGNIQQKEYEDTLGDIRNINDLGSTKWNNLQENNENIYRNYQNENLWMWPQMRNVAQTEAYGNIFEGLNKRNLNLDQIAGLNVRYNELEKETSDLRNKLQIKNQQDLERAKIEEAERVRLAQIAEENSRRQQQRQQRQQRQQQQQQQQQQQWWQGLLDEPPNQKWLVPPTKQELRQLREQELQQRQRGQEIRRIIAQEYGVDKHRWLDYSGKPTGDWGRFQVSNESLRPKGYGKSYQGDLDDLNTTQLEFLLRNAQQHLGTRRDKHNQTGEWWLSS